MGIYLNWLFSKIRVDLAPIDPYSPTNMIFREYLDMLIITNKITQLALFLPLHASRFSTETAILVDGGASNRKDLRGANNA